MGFFKDYNDSLVVIIPLFEVKRNNKLQKKLNELKEILEDNQILGHPDIAKSIYEIEHFNQKIEFFENAKKEEQEHYKKQQEKNEKLLFKEIIEEHWQKMPIYWIDVTQFNILDEDEKIILSKNDFTKRGNIKSSAKERVLNYLYQHTEEFLLKTVWGNGVLKKYRAGLIRNISLSFKEYAIGIKYECKYIREYVRRKNGSVYGFRLKVIDIDENGKLLYPFDATKYIFNKEDNCWYRKVTDDSKEELWRRKLIRK